MKDHPVKSMHCPACAAPVRMALNVANARMPKEGDPTICSECRALLAFSGTPVDSLRYPTDAEEKRFLADPVVQRTIAAVADMHRIHGQH